MLTASAEILRALVAGSRRKHSVTSGSNGGGHRDDVAHDALEQALTIVYRLLFLLFAEARALVPLWHPVYRESYSIESLRDAAERSAAAVGPVGCAARDRPARARRAAAPAICG